MKLRWTPLALVVCIGTWTLACEPGKQGQATSSMMEDDQHVATSEDKALAEGKPRPLPAEPPARGEEGKPPSAMIDDLEPSRGAIKPSEGPVKLEEPRPGAKSQPEPRK